MKSTVFASAVVLASADFAAFKAKYGKVYNGDEEAAAEAQYNANMQWAAENSNDDVQFGENQFSDLNQEQYRVAAGLGYKGSAYRGLPFLGEHEYHGEELAATVDWTTRGAVTAVKNQGQCGSCWAFSTTGGMEGAWQIGSGSLKSMSEQQLVDCSTANAGCNGGSMESAFSYAHGVNVATESSYPYTARDGTCKTSYTTAIPRGGITGYKRVSQSTDALKSALNSGPVSVAIEADQMSFQMYSGGVLSSGCGTNLDHGVLAVGYDSTSFKVKNSWGASWGANGYIQISQSGNTCGIHSDASYPTVSASVLSAKDERWEAFKARYQKVYNGDEEEAAKAQYDANMQWAEENSNDEVQFGENQFSDLNQEQYRVAAGLGYKGSAYRGLPFLGEHEYHGEELAAAVDWTTRGAVTPVKNQGQCGSCWAFSTTGGMEGAWQIGSGSLKSLSEQQLVDCSTANAGCNGGSMESAFSYAHGVDVATESSYPYTARDGSCKSSYTTAIPRGGITGYKRVSQSTDALKSALNSGPVSVAIEADQMSFQMYSGGVLSSGCGTNLDHGVLAVGYDSTSFKVKNSWGASWGANGYIQISQSGNTCGIHSDASYPTVSASVAV